MGKYNDIINLERPKLNKRRVMTIEDRAAQFAPFAALSGYEEAVKETGRFTEKRTELDQNIKDEISRKLQLLVGKINEKPEINIQYYKADSRKKGGTYLAYRGRLVKIDEYNQILIMEDQTRIPIKEIVKFK